MPTAVPAILHLFDSARSDVVSMSMLDDEKKALRQQAAQIRKKAFDALPNAPQLVSSYAAQLHALFSPRLVAAYWPIRTEIDPIPLMGALCELGAESCLPATPQEGNPLRFYKWRIGEPLIDGPYNTKEPAGTGPGVQPDLILAPLLAYDENCWRLGYGGGFYDRTIASLADSGHVAQIIGIAFDDSCVAKVPTGPYDKQLSAILTPSGLRRPVTMN